MKMMMLLRSLPVVLTAALVAPSPPAHAQAPAPRLSNERVLLRTNRGDLVLALYPDIAPKHTEQILKLVRLGVYDSTWFHRVEPGFVVQLTDAQNRKNPLTPEQIKAIAKLPAETSAVQHRTGVLSMARGDDPNSAETSFSILLAPAPHLDGKYTVFGQVEWGMPLMGMVVREPRDEKNAPREPLIVESATVKTAEEIAGMAGLRQLRQPKPLMTTASAPLPERQSAAAASSGISPFATIAILLMLLCNLIAFLFSTRFPAQTRSALTLLPVLIGVFVLVAEYGPHAGRVPVLGVAMFFGVVGLFKLMNRFESVPPPASPPSERPAAK